MNVVKNGSKGCRQCGGDGFMVIVNDRWVCLRAQHTEALEFASSPEGTTALDRLDELETELEEARDDLSSAEMRVSDAEDSIMAIERDIEALRKIMAAAPAPLTEGVSAGMFS